MNAVQIVEIETALRSLADDCRLLMPPGLPAAYGMQPPGYGGGFRSGLEHLAEVFDELVEKLKGLRSPANPARMNAALDLLHQCRAAVAQGLELYLLRPDQWGTGRSTACRWCLPPLDDIIQSAERAG